VTSSALRSLRSGCRLDAADPGWLPACRLLGRVHAPGHAGSGLGRGSDDARHTEGFADLNRSEAEELGPLLSAVSEA